MMRQDLPVILLVLLAVGTSPFISNVAAAPVLSVVNSSTSERLRAGVVYPVVDVEGDHGGTQKPLGPRSDFQPKPLGVTGSSAAGPMVLASLGNSSTVNVLFGFEGLGQAQSCTCVPPDVQIAAGPNSVVEMVNLEGEVFAKQGVAIESFTLSSFFKTGSDSLSDPKILFDASGSRWFASIADVTLGKVIVGVSRTTDPAGTWVFYPLSAGGFLPDQPIIGVSDDKFVVSVNDYLSNTFEGSQYWVLNKAEMLAGSAASFVTPGRNTSFFSIHPVHSLSSTTVQFMVSNIVVRRAISTGSVELFSVTGVPGVSTVTASTTALKVSTLSVPPRGVQPGTSSVIDTGDLRVQDASWFMGELWYGLDDACTPAGDSQARSCIRLTMIDTTNSTVKQDFDLGFSGQYLFYPALGVDSRGGLDVVYGYSSSTIFPSIAVTGRAMTDSADVLDPPAIIRLGSASDTSTRYGDYFGAAFDPSTAAVVWVAGEYHSSTTGSCGSFGSCWSTFISSMFTGSPVFIGSGGGSRELVT